MCATTGAGGCIASTAPHSSPSTTGSRPTSAPGRTGSPRWTRSSSNSETRRTTMAATAKHSAVVTLPTDTQILITREFDAPRHLVFRAWTTPEFIRRWWSACRGEVTVAEVDLRVGGRWRYAMMAHGEFEVAFHGEFREITPNERIV